MITLIVSPSISSFNVLRQTYPNFFFVCLNWYNNRCEEFDPHKSLPGVHTLTLVTGKGELKGEGRYDHREESKELRMVTVEDERPKDHSTLRGSGE